MCLLWVRTSREEDRANRVLLSLANGKTVMDGDEIGLLAEKRGQAHDVYHFTSLDDHKRVKPGGNGQEQHQKLMPIIPCLIAGVEDLYKLRFNYLY